MVEAPSEPLVDRPAAPAVATNQAKLRTQIHCSEAVTVIVAAMAITAGRCRAGAPEGAAGVCTGQGGIGAGGRGGPPYGSAW